MSVVTIEQLKVRGRGVDARQVGAVLQLAPWPREEREYVFLRRVAVRAPAVQLGLEAGEAAVRLCSEAIPGTEPGLEAAGAIRFGSLAQMIACLSRDLADARAARYWHWRTWKGLFELPASRALVELWWSYPHDLPAIATWLEHLGALPQCWAALSQRHAAALWQHLLAGTGEQRGAVERAGQRAHSAPEPLPPRLVHPWAPALRSAAASADHARLAAVLVLRQWRPTWLLGPRTEAALDWIATALGAENGARDSVAEPPSGEPVMARSAEGAVRAGTRPSAPSAPSAAITSGLSPSGSPPVTADSPPAKAPVRSAVDSAPHQGPAAAAEPHGVAPRTHARPMPGPSRDQAQRSSAVVQAGEPSAEVAPAEPAHAQPLCEREQSEAGRARELIPPREGVGASRVWLTEQGGLFYLLNFLDLPHVQQQLCRSTDAELFPSGWGWLYRLGQALGAQPDPPLLAFLDWGCWGSEGATERSLAGRPFEALEALPELESLESLLQLGAKRYPMHALWNACLFPMPARIESHPGYLEVEFPLERLRLEVRLSGLDVDPGFLPWIGRVVRFHYVQSSRRESRRQP